MVLYFAYGSNMLMERLRVADRCPGAARIGIATAAEHAVVFHKRSNRDGSGKATLRAEPGATAHGVLFAIDEGERDALDLAEGVGNGYERRDDFVVVAGGVTHVAATYIATGSHHDADLVPFDWYHALVVAGARQHDLPTDYVARLEAVATDPDPDPHRPEKLNALRLLRAAGHADLVARIEFTVP